MNFVENCKIRSKEVLVHDIKRIINSVKFGYSYDDLYLSITLFGGTQGSWNCSEWIALCFPGRCTFRVT